MALGLCDALRPLLVAIPVLAIAGSLARKKIVPAGAGTLPTHTPLFVGLLVGVVILVGALTFVPAAGARADRRTSHADRCEVR